MPRIPRTAWIWGLLLIVLLAWNAYTFLPSQQEQVRLPYSTMVAQVQAGNVARVQISGDQITGTFVKPLLWPPTPTAAAAEGSKQPAAPPAGTPTAPGSPAPATCSEFVTTFPQAIGDTNLMPLLVTHGVEVDVAPPPSPWLGMLVTGALPVLLMVLFLVWMGRQAAQSQAGIFSFGRSKARRYTPDRPQVTFDDVAGADEAKLELQEVVDFLRQPKKYHDLGARIPRGVLLVGPPGTGKTLMARAVAGEAGVPFFNISASEFVEMFVGVGASRVRDLFEKAKTAAPAIVFIDEMDAVGRRRGAGLGSINDEREQTLNQMLVEMDGFDERHEVIVLAATNRPDVLDPALLRPGRFDRQVVINLPDRKGREGILRIHTRSLHLAGDVNLSVLARSTTGLSGADLANLCNEAALVAARRNHNHVTKADIEEALDKVVLGELRPLLLDPHDRRVVACHEAGHALVAWLTPAADPVHKVTIIPRGRALGVTEQLPGDDHYNYSKEYLLARLSVMLGGRAAEELVIGDITTGAENDLVEATRLARRMVARWGMGSLGPVAFQSDEQQPFLGYELAQGRDYSEATAAQIDQDVQLLLKERHEAVYCLLADQRPRLDLLIETLLHDETIDQDTLATILGARPEAAEPVLSDAHA
jgi:cell division protease FtsH